MTSIDFIFKPIKNIFLTTVVFLFASICVSAQDNTIQPTTIKTNIARPIQKNVSPKPKIIAHRGAWKKLNLPQNSIASLRQAIKLKFYGSEFDIRMTSDDSLIINHDPTFFDMEIEQSTYAELIEHKLSNGEKLPTLREYILSGIHKNKKTKLICEIKPSGISVERSLLIAQKAHQQIQFLKAQDKVIYISFSYAVLKKIIELDTNVSTQYLGGDVSPEQLKIDLISGLDYQILKIKNRSEWLDSAKKNMVTLNAWTINTVEDMDWIIQNDFDFITTDEPELFKKKIK
ncbi:MAG: glycerophosphodiester phosphodiesterase family protein [Flavobacteriaceae bacterium]|nr:glycerophosphodiester phosphodiesterase family protein [Flavobacteriaceae bacterium]